MENMTDELIKGGSQENKTPLHMLLAKKTKRMFGAIIDMCIVALSGMILSAVVSIPLTDFKNMSEQAVAQINVMNDLATATHLYKFDESEQPISDEDMFTTYLTAKLSTDNEAFVQGDALLFYYVEHQLQTMAYFNREILELPEKLEGENTSPFWQYAATVEDPAIFKSGIKDLLSAARSGSSDENAVATFDAFETFFVEKLSGAREHYANLTSTLAQYDIYATIVEEMMARSSLASGLTFIFVALIFYVLVPFVKNDGRTLAKRAMGMTLVDLRGEKPKSGQILLRGFLEMMTFSVTLVFIPFLNWGYTSFYLPIISIGGFSLTYMSIGLASFAISMVSLVVMSISSDARSIHDFAARTMVTDTNLYRIAKIKEESK